MKIKEARAVYTGGNIWLFFGRLEDGNYFIVDDDGWVGIADESAEAATEYGWDEWAEWYNKHMLREPEGKEREQFCSEMLDRLAEYEYGSDNNGGFTPDLIEAYRRYFREEM